MFEIPNIAKGSGSKAFGVFTSSNVIIREYGKSEQIQYMNVGECDDWKMKECTFHYWNVGL